MEIVTVSGPPPEDTLSVAYLEWRDREFVLRGALVLNQSSQIESLQAHVRSLERRVAEVVESARGLVKPPPPPELVEDAPKPEEDLSDDVGLEPCAPAPPPPPPVPLPATEPEEDDKPF